MLNPYPTVLRARALGAYEAGDEASAVVAARFEVGVATLQRCVRRQRTTGAAPYCGSANVKRPLATAMETYCRPLTA
jgi:transposase